MAPHERPRTNLSSAAGGVEPTGATVADEAPLPDPPDRRDGGWSWVVLIGAVLSQLMVFGFYGGAGVYVPVWMDYFDTLAAETSLIISLSSCFMGLLSIVAGILISRFGVRPVWMTGGVITPIGLLVSALATSTIYLIFSMSFITALGFSMCVNSGLVSLSLYFKKHLAFAVGVASAGFAAGQLVLGPLFNALIDVYGWRGSLVIYAALMMHMIPAGALVRPSGVRKHMQRQVKKSVETGGDTPRTVTQADCCEEDGSPWGRFDVAGETLTQNDPSHARLTASTLPGDSAVESLDNDNTSCSTQDITTEKSSSIADITQDDADTCSEERNNNGPARTQESDEPELSGVIHPGSLTNGEVTSLEMSPVVESTDLTKPGLRRSYISRLWTFLLEQYGLYGLFHNPSFVLIIPAGLAHGFGWASVVFHLSTRAESVGLSASEGASLLAIMGGGALFTSLIHGWIIDRWHMSPILAYVSGIFCNCLFSVTMPQFVTFGPLAAVSALFGMATGVAEPVIFVVMQILVRPSEIAGATSLFLVAWGAGELIGASLAGMIYDTVDSYDNAYYMSASVFLCGALLGFVIFILERNKVKREERLASEDAKAIPIVAEDFKDAAQGRDGTEIVNPMFDASNGDDGLVEEVSSKL